MSRRDYRTERRAQITDHARSIGLDGVLVYSWRRQAVGWLTGYAPGYVTNQAALWLGADGQQRLVVRFPFDVARAEAVTGLPAVAADGAADVVPPGTSRIGLVAGDSAVDESTSWLNESLAALDLDLVDLRPWLDDLQVAKLPGEIAALRHAGEIAASALDLWPMAPAGRSDWEIAADIEAIARRRGARRAICLVGVGPGAVVTECTGRTVEPTDSVGLELTMYVAEWCMHVNRHLPAENESDEQRQARRVCAQARAAMLAEMAVGMRVTDLVAIGDETLKQAGLLDAKEYDFGHGLAGDTPAPPLLIAGTGGWLGKDSIIALHVAVRVPNGPTGFIGGPVLLGHAGGEELNPTAPWAIETANAHNA